MMNKKFLISSVLVVTGLYLTACSKQEEPKTDTQAETSQQNPSQAPLHPISESEAPMNHAQVAPPPMAASEPKHADMVMAQDDTPPPPRPHHPKPHHVEPKPATPPQVDVQREVTENTTTEIRREYKKPHQTTDDTAKPHVEPVAAVVDTPKAEKPKRSSANLTQDDAVAAAMAAAKPAL